MTEYIKHKCTICNDERGKMSGEYCRDNEKSPHYDDDLITGTDYMDCWVFIRTNETEQECKDRVFKQNQKDKP